VDFIININEIQRILRADVENIYPNKVENLEEMDKFLDAFDLPKLSQEDTNKPLKLNYNKQ
jgi:hypothetical protein